MELIDRVRRLGRPSRYEFTAEYFCRSPVVMTDLMSNWPAMDWTLETLRERFAGARLPVRMDDHELDAYCQATGDSSLREPRTARRITFKELSFFVIELDAYFAATLRGGEASARLPCVLDVPLTRSTVVRYLEVMKLDGEDWTPLVDALETLIDDVAFPGYLVGELDRRFWFTPRPRPQGTIHADGYHNLNAQIRGRKQWILQSPEQRAAGTTALTCATSAGEMLYIPKGWWHAAAALDCTINVNAWHTI